MSSIERSLKVQSERRLQELSAKRQELSVEPNKTCVVLAGHQDDRVGRRVCTPISSATRPHATEMEASGSTPEVASKFKATVLTVERATSPSGPISMISTLNHVPEHARPSETDENFHILTAEIRECARRAASELETAMVLFRVADVSDVETSTSQSTEICVSDQNTH
jgi:hypothetical protein